MRGDVPGSLCDDRISPVVGFVKAALSLEEVFQFHNTTNKNTDSIERRTPFLRCRSSMVFDDCTASEVVLLQR
jgi:hypothetical protein